MSGMNVFDALRRVDGGGPSSAGRQAGGQLFFQLAENDSGFRLRTVDKAGTEISVDHRAYNGAQRELLRAMESASSTWGVEFSWDGDEATGLALADHSHLMWLLARCDNVVDSRGEALSFSAEPIELVLELKQADGWVSGHWMGRSEDRDDVVLKALRMLTDSHVLANGIVYAVEPIGPSFRSLTLFGDRVPAVQINECLTLLFSSLQNVTVDYEGFAVQQDAAISARPALIFQQVDAHAALHLEVSQSLAGFSVDFVRDYDIVRAAFVDEMERLVRVREVHYAELLAAREDLLKRLRKLSRTLKSEESYLIDDEEGLVLGPDLAEAFLQRHLGELAGVFQLFGAEKLKVYKVKQATPSLHVSLDHGIDFLEGDAELEIEGERVALFAALQQYRKQSYVSLSDGTKALVDPRYMERLTRLFKKQQDGVKVSFFDLPMIDELIGEQAAHAFLPESRAVFSGFNELAKKRLPLPNFSGKLRPYQMSGLAWMDYLYGHGLGGCLADDMGLGKTIQTIALLTRMYPKTDESTLLVMPKSLLFNWQRELETFAPDLTYYVYYAGDRDLAEARKSHLILTTYGMLRSDIELFSAEPFHAVILDEAQAIKNLQSQTARAAMALRSRFRLALSGTPVENNLGELYSLFSFLNPAMFGSGSEFDRDYVQPIQKFGDKEAAHELRRKIYPFILRRLKGDVLKELPPKVEQVLYVDMGEDQRAFYETRRRFYHELVNAEIEKSGLAKSQFVVLEALSELRQIASVPESKSDGRITSAKREALMDTLQDAVLNGRKCLVFTNFLAGIEQVSEALNEAGIEHVTMSGSTSNRQQLVERFQHDSKLKVFVMTLKTGGVGLNLTVADTVFILDPWWNTSAEAQAVDRTHRMGQKNTVFTYRLIARNTIEEKIQALQQQKKDLVDQIISSDGAALKSLSATDIDHLLGA